MRNIFSAIQSAFTRQQFVSHDPVGIKEMERMVDELLQNPGVRQLLAGYEAAWRPEFSAFVEARFATYQTGSGGDDENYA